MICQASLNEKKALKDFDAEIIMSADKGNPYLISFVDDGHFVDESYEDPSRYKFFMYKDDPSGEIIARCGVHFAPTKEDIYGYGKQARRLYDNVCIATLIGDLVHPSSRGRGIQREMIEYRLDYLFNAGFDGVAAGIIEGNDASFSNYLAFGFSVVGEKTITWSTGEKNKVSLLFLDLKKNSGFACKPKVDVLRALEGSEKIGEHILLSQIAAKCGFQALQSCVHDFLRGNNNSFCEWALGCLAKQKGVESQTLIANALLPSLTYEKRFENVVHLVCKLYDLWLIQAKYQDFQDAILSENVESPSEFALANVRHLIESDVETYLAGVPVEDILA